KAADCVSSLAPSTIHVEFQLPPKCAISLQSTALSAFQPLKSPTRFHEDPVNKTLTSGLPIGSIMDLLMIAATWLGRSAQGRGGEQWLIALLPRRCRDCRVFFSVESSYRRGPPSILRFRQASCSSVPGCGFHSFRSANEA